MHAIIVIQDLQSANLLVCASALIALCKLVTKDMIPALMPHVVVLLKHKNPVIRKKAVMGVMRFWQLDSDSIASHRSVIGRQICDPDPSVMGSGICLTYEMIKVTLSNLSMLVRACVRAYARACVGRVRVL